MSLWTLNQHKDLEDLELIIRTKSTGEILYQGDVTKFDLKRHIYSCHNYEDINAKEHVSGPEVTLDIAIKNLEDASKYKEALKKYAIVERII
jgi:hypothetical protein